LAINIQTFKTRALTALVFVAVMLSGLFINGYLFVALFITVMLGCLYEFSKIHTLISGPKDLKFYSVSFFYIIVPVLLFIGFGCDFKYYDLIKNNSYNSYTPCLILFSIWINDTMAYLVGSFIGKTPLSKISPKKTWEGTIGGIILCVLLIFIGTEFLLHDFKNISNNIIISAICGVFGTLGDLLESKFKRTAKIKDSGKFMPGHGGFLDRFDSLLIATPAVFIYYIIFALIKG
jgi:phosphatidate cytidylyltransferase